MKASTSNLDLQLALAQARALDSNWITRMEGRKEVAKLEAKLSRLMIRSAKQAARAAIAKATEGGAK